MDPVDKVVAFVFILMFLMFGLLIGCITFLDYTKLTNCQCIEAKEE